MTGARARRFACLGAQAPLRGRLMLALGPALVLLAFASELTGASSEAGGGREPGLTLILFTIGAGILWSGVTWGLRPLRDLERALASDPSGTLSRIHRLAPREIAALAGEAASLASQLDLARAAEQRLITDAAHQLGNPVAALKAQAEAALSAKDVRVLRARVEELAISAGDAGRLVRQLMALAEAKSLAPDDMAPVDLCSLVHAVTLSRASEALRLGLDIALTQPETEVSVSGNRALLADAVDNLVLNALHHGRGSRVDVSLLTDGGAALIRVADDGIGIDPSERDAIFDAFVRGRSRGRATGAGLGLAIARTVATAHGGSVRCPPQQTGALFEIALPIRVGAASP